MKTIFIVILVILGIAYINDPKSVQPWLNSANHAGDIVSHTVQKAGEAVERTARDESHKDSSVERAKDKINDTITGK